MKIDSAVLFPLTALLAGTAAFAPLLAVAGASPAPTESAAPQAAAGVLLDPADTVLMLLDHQTGLFQTVKDIPVRDLRANTVADCAASPVPTSSAGVSTAVRRPRRSSRGLRAGGCRPCR